MRIRVRGGKLEQSSADILALHVARHGELLNLSHQVRPFEAGESLQVPEAVLVRGALLVPIDEPVVVVG